MQVVHQTVYFMIIVEMFPKVFNQTCFKPFKNIGFLQITKNEKCSWQILIYLIGKYFFLLTSLHFIVNHPPLPFLTLPLHPSDPSPSLQVNLFSTVWVAQTITSIRVSFKAAVTLNTTQFILFLVRRYLDFELQINNVHLFVFLYKWPFGMYTKYI